MLRIARFLLPLVALLPHSLAAQEIAYDFDFGEPELAIPLAQDGGERMVEVAHAQPLPAGGAYGPFRVVDDVHAALEGVTDETSDADFAAMMRDHPGIATIEMVDCPGTEDDRVNLRLGRMIRARGIATHVPADGFVASGAVELYLAGVRRSAEPGAEFAVHSWEDDTGREPADYAPDAPRNRAYLDYYRAMGMSEGQARSFYAMTNSVPFSGAKWMTAADMDHWARFDEPARVPAAPQYARAAAAKGDRPGGAPVRGGAYGSFPIVSETHAVMAG